MNPLGPRLIEAASYVATRARTACSVAAAVTGSTVSAARYGLTMPSTWAVQANRYGGRRVPVGMTSWRMLREHRFSQRHLPAMLDDELTSRQRLRLQAHADLCPECGPVLRDLLHLRRLLLGAGGSGRAESSRADGILQYLSTAR